MLLVQTMQVKGMVLALLETKKRSYKKVIAIRVEVFHMK